MALTRSFQHAFNMGPPTPMIQVPEGASQTFKEGEVIIASSGYGVVGAADPAVGTIIGVSCNAGNNTTAGLYNIGIVPALNSVVFEGQLQNGAGTAAIAQTDLFLAYSINVTSNVWWIDKDDTTHKDTMIVGFKDAVGTVNGVVYFVFLPLMTVFGANAAQS